MVFRGLGCGLSPFWGGFASLSVWFDCMIPGLYKIIQYTLSLPPVVFQRSESCFFSSGGFCVPVWFGLVVWYPVCTKLLNTPSLSDGHYGTSLFWIPAVVSLRSGLLCPPPSGIFVCSSGSDRFFVPGLYEVIQYTLFLFFTLPVFVSSMLASSSEEIVKTSRYKKQ